MESKNKIYSLISKEYRLLKKADGTLVLQGCFYWSQGDIRGFEWRDIPTAEE